MADLGRRAVVDAPPATPPRLSLVSAAADLQTLADPDDRLEVGFAFAPESCGAASGSTPWGCTPQDRDPDTTNPENVDTVAWNVWAADTCATFDRTRDRAGRARRLLLACESKQIASELWTGAIGQAEGWPNRRFASPDADEVTSTATEPFTALACLERGLQLCSCGGRGMIHASAEVVSLWSERGVLRREGNLILTIHDTIVVTDAGYDGSSPEGVAAAAGSVWAYATGLVYVRRGPVEIRGDDATGVDRSTNTWTVWAERSVAATWADCCHLAAEIDIDICTIGGS